MKRRALKQNLIPALAAIFLAAALVFLAVPMRTASASDYSAPGYDPVVISDSVAYDPLTRDFVFTTEDGSSSLHCSVLSGMVVSSPVSVSGGGVFLYRNGKEYEGSLDPVSDAGEYVVMINTGERNERMLTFTIVGNTTNTVHTYKLPTGMIVNEVYFNGEAQEDFDYTSVPMEKEGAYRVISECIASGTVYTLETTVDRTAPELQFEGRADKRGRFGSAVTITGLNNGEKVNVTRDGETFEVEKESDGSIKLVNSGVYNIVAYDEAGNLSEYSILIMAYLNASGIAFVVLLILTIAAVVIYIIVKRRKLRIG